MIEPGGDGEMAAASIEAIEARIEILRERIERCRKAMILSRGAIRCGAGLIGLALLLPAARNAVVVLLGLSAIIAGFTWLGANKSTREEAEAALGEAEADRDGLIDGVSMRDVVVPFRLP
ncbi:MAG TPA: hypothetical protein VHD15_18230 [Hyphomicrobiales bacterium]|nr:hypothetical protein [Hyphomicrobiales bacterium]